MERYICIHGHFYQPPRENPWLEAIEVQDSSYPYHDWNERITTECYAPNAVARFLDAHGRIERLVNNYSRISFNFGPTLLSWMEEKAPDVYAAILEADRESQKVFGGHGSALAQVYNHPIMPLCNRMDQVTQVVWGIRDFEHRFGRKPEGMWLAETAADLNTLEVLAEAGIRFTILSPYQAARVRPLPSGSAQPGHWHDVHGGRIDPTTAYLQRLPSGRSITLFFYDGLISRAVAFEGLLIKGEYLAGRLLGAFSDSRAWPQLVHIATDGETYGHHHRHGDMALVYALEHIEANGKGPNAPRLTNYSQFLTKHPPTHEVEIIEKTAWSCAHGVERWRSNCGCNSGGRPGWNQEWRGPLREGLDWLRDTLAPLYEEKLGQLLNDPWAARNNYVSVLLDRSPGTVDRFLHRHARRDLSRAEQVTALKLLELQRQALLMYTSCGWFFDELTGIETLQVLHYAARVLQLAGEIFPHPVSPAPHRGEGRGSDSAPLRDGEKAEGAKPQAAKPTDGRGGFEEGFLRRLEKARSNLPEFGDGRKVYHKFVKPFVVDWTKVGAHYAVSSLFESYPREFRLFCYDAVSRDYQLFKAGKAKLAVGQARLTSGITREAAEMGFAVLHFGDHNVNGGVKHFPEEEPYRRMTAEVVEAFTRADFPEVVRLLDRHFGQATYSLRSLFRDEQRSVLQRVLQAPQADAEAVYRRLYEQNQPTMRFLASLGAPLPSAFRQAAHFLINNDLLWAFEEDEPDLAHIRSLIQEAATWQVQLDSAGMGYRLKNTLGRIAERARTEPDNRAVLRTLRSLVELGKTLPCELNLWQAQNVWFSLAWTAFAEYLGRLVRGDDEANEWLEQFLGLGEALGIQVGALKKKLDEVRAQPRPDEVGRSALSGRRVPGATYRVQLHRGFTFGDAQGLIPYLNELGVSDLHTSPILMARPGSPHGRDVCDHGRINPELGGEAGFLGLADAARGRGMGLLLEAAPGHMSVADPANVWWADILENGPSSLYASHFDIDWRPTNPDLESKVLLPILEEQYGRALEAGKFTLVYEAGGFVLHYRGFLLPVAPRTYGNILRHALAWLAEQRGGVEADSEGPDVEELRSILTALRYLPPRTERSAERIRERQREKEIVKRRIARLYDESPAFRAALHDAVRAFNGTVGDPDSFALLDALIDEQAYRPAYWRVATEEINYRRFFDVNDLAALRVEVPEVFRATHALLLRLLAEGRATGLCIEHPDGLWDPAAYFRQLQEAYLAERVRASLPAGHSPRDAEAALAEARRLLAAVTSGGGARAWPLYVIADKVLIGSEPLPADWAVDGTTGYEFLNAANGLFVDGRNGPAFDRLYAEFLAGDRPALAEDEPEGPRLLHDPDTPEPLDYDRLVFEARKMTMLGSLASEIDDLAHRLDRLAETNRRYRDFTLISLTRAVRETIACLPVYRSYIRGLGAVSEQDQRAIEQAVARAKRHDPRTAAPVFDFVRDTLLLRNVEDFREEDRPALLDWVMKFQQLTGPVMAKGVEDTAFSIYNRLVSLNEVGGGPPRFGQDVEAFHRQNEARLRDRPHSLLTTASRATKRSEDARARIDVLSEIPEEWRQALGRWSGLNAGHKTAADGRPAPDRNDEYLLYQMLVGTWPGEPLSGEALAAYRGRAAAFMERATKDAKVHTSRINPDEDYDAAVRDFVHRALSDDPGDAFRKDLGAFAARVAYFGRFNSLGQLLLKLASPGVPDVYQGTELWDFGLGDPDRFDPVDFQLRRKLLADLKHRSEKGGELLRLSQTLLTQSADGRVKLYLLWRTLNFRRGHSALFDKGGYVPLYAAGEKAGHVCAFLRSLEAEEVLVAVPRLVVGLTGGQERPPLGLGVWGETRLRLPAGHAGRRYRNLYTGEVLQAREEGGQGSLMLSAVFAHWPAALLERVER